MYRRAVAMLLIAAGSAGGCGTEQDNRPLELEYLTQAVFAPSCGTSQCHSSFRQVAGFVFDKPEAVRRSLVSTETGGTTLLRFDYDHPDPAFSYTSRLIQMLSFTVPFPQSPEILRMPLDAPLPNKDIELLRTWIKNPDRGEPPFDVGGRAIGAQCDPDLNPHRYACDRDHVVTCTEDWNFGETLVVCPRGCQRVFPTICHDPSCTSPTREECEVPCDPELPEDMCRE